MGTYVTVTVDEPGRGADKRLAIEKAFQEMERVQSLLTIHTDTSALSELNRHKYLKHPPVELREVISRAVYYGDLSGGAFDVTVKPLLDLYRSSYLNHDRLPAPSEVRTCLKSVGYASIVLGEGSIEIGNPRASVTLDGIAKGYVVDRGLGLLQDLGIKRALINAGGDARALGKKTGGPWLLALKNPFIEEDVLAVIELDDRAVATSGDYEAFFSPNKSNHHIIDPRTGHSPTSLTSVTVVAPTCMDADALATSITILGIEEGMALIESLADVEALLMTSNRKILLSSGFEAVGKILNSKAEDRRILDASYFDTSHPACLLTPQ